MLRGNLNFSSENTAGDSTCSDTKNLVNDVSKYFFYILV